MPGEIKLKTIEELLELDQLEEGKFLPKYSFFIPEYQRGYRWTQKEVVQLLRDIQEFTETADTTGSEFYCLQPVVVKKMNPEDERLKERDVQGQIIYELIDGQQRITTIYLVLWWLNQRYQEKYQRKPFQVFYQTRTSSENYLSIVHCDKTEQYKENIDFFHIHHAYKCIELWFERAMTNQKHIGEIESALLKKVKPIWYEIPKESTAVTVFRNLNVGKIGLTNSELIKALFLRKNEKFQVVEQAVLYEIANDWELISKRLLDDDFWYFISNSKVEKFRRIDYLFSIAAKDYSDEGISKDDNLRDFLIFQNALENSESRLAIWKDFKKIFLTLESWYEDRLLFHLIGYLILSDSFKKKGNLQELVADLLKNNRSLGYEEFVQELKSLVNRTVSTPFEKMTYDGTPTEDKKRMLLLFNLSSLHENKTSKEKFNFTEFKLQNWDIEHIKSVASKKPVKKKKQIVWLKSMIWYYTGQPLGEFKEPNPDEMSEEVYQLVKEMIDLIQDANSNKINEDKFDKVYKRVLEISGEKQDSKVDHSIGNLTLLDEGTNRSYGNTIFPLKRRIIIENEVKGVFVPLCTKNVFLKLYSNNPSNLQFWTSDDIKDYGEKIILGINKFIE